MVVSPQVEAPSIVRPLKEGDTNAQYIDCMDVLRLPNYHGEVALAEVATKTEIQQQQMVLQSLVYAHRSNSAQVHELQSSHNLVHAYGLVLTS